MANYTLVQCSICRRERTVPTDNRRAMVNTCTITKGCAGRLFKVGESALALATTPVAGVSDWTAPGTVATVPVASTSPALVSLTNSQSGALVLAIYQNAASTTANPTIRVRLDQLKSQTVSSQQYFFKPTVASTIISGRDSTGRFMRFDAAAAAGGRVFVRVNGVVRTPGVDLTLSANTVTFTSAVAAGAAIDITVYQEQEVISHDLHFAAVTSTPLPADLGAWGNVSWLRELDATGAPRPQRWWVYTSQEMATVPSSAVLRLNSVLRADGVTPLCQLAQARWILSSQPHAAVDRYLNFYVDSTVLHSDYLLSFAANAGNAVLSADSSALAELYPPLQLVASSVPGAGSFRVADSIVSGTALVQDSALARLVGKKIIGPL